MGDGNPSVNPSLTGDVEDAAPGSQVPDGTIQSHAFHSQLDYLSQPEMQSVLHANPYGQHAFEMGHMMGALPQPPMGSRHMFSPESVYAMQQASHYHVGQGQQYDAAAVARAQQQQQFLNSPYSSLPSQAHMGPPRPPMPIQLPGQVQYNQFDPYGYGMSPVHGQHLDPRFAHQMPYPVPHSLQNDPSQFARRASEPVAVPSFPRGPPRKPKQSGHALWVGNLPPAATVSDLKDHFSRDATKDIESLFLISKSNCAFVNYRTEAACVAAMNRFHDSRFYGVRLVCRLRRGTAAGSNSAPTLATPVALETSETPSSTDSPAGPPSPAVVDEPTTPTIVASSQFSTAAPPTAPEATTTDGKVLEKYFIVKSLTVQDLEASVRNGIWATQSHNEITLNRAYDEAQNVYLVFSANKSGEYFGYARMASTISGEPVDLSASVSSDGSRSPGVPHSIPTPATTSAPKGRIIDDSARGTIFWEAEHSDDSEEESTEGEASEGLSGQNWGRQFTVEWLSTTRLPFYRTRGLRNPWNSNREVKIARDGTELEPGVGRRLVQMFHKPSPGPVPSQPGMPYR